MCSSTKCSPKKRAATKVEPVVDGVLFTTDQFEALEPGSLEIVAKGTPGRILIAAHEGKAQIQRADRLNSSTVARKAIELAEQSGNEVAVAELAGFDRNGRAVWKQSGRVRAAKADALSDEAYLDWVRRLSAHMEEIARLESSGVLNEAMEWLDFDYDRASFDRLERAIAGAREILANPPERMISALGTTSTAMMATVMARVVRAAARIPAVSQRMRDRLIPSLELRDRNITNAMGRHLGFWVRDQYRQRSPQLAAGARRIIQTGIDRGLGRQDIARMLRERLGNAYPMRGYWQTVAHNAVARSRSFALGRSYQHAGITHLRIEAILDEQTTETCRFLDGKIIPVDRSVDRMERAMRDPNPEGVLWHTPFMREEMGPDGDEMGFEFPDGSTTPIARVIEPGMGTQSPGRYSAISGNLADAGVGMPPYHHNCRTTTVPELGPPIE